MNNFYATKRSGKTLKIAINTALLFFALIVSGNSAFAQCPTGIPQTKYINSGTAVNLDLVAYPSSPTVSYMYRAKADNLNILGEKLGPTYFSSSTYNR